MAEAELSILSRQCLAERVGSQEELAADVGAWVKARNKLKRIADWQFKNADARIKLKKLYPSV